ncbi:MAG: hypothetical protein CMK32_10220 [Porticoccaceae bacterium]|nr:hypothetical protein [Porticoccaceae bacterium]
MNDWQAQTVAQAQADIDKTKSIEELEPIGTDILLSSQPWYRQACWPVVVRKRKEFLGEDKPKMLIVDAMNWIRADFSQSQDMGQAQDSFMRRVRMLEKKVQPRWIVIASDERDGLIRKDICPEYKKSRNDRPQEITNIARVIAASCEFYQVPWIQIDGHEADDVAATMTTRCIVRGGQVVVCTSDKDYYQIICRGVVAWSKGEYTNAEGVEEKVGIKPNQIVDYLCLTGKDDVPSAVGIGPQTAAQWLKEHGDFIGIYDHRHSLTEKKREAVEQFAPHYWVARTCHTLNRRLEIDFDWSVTPVLD